MSLPLPIVNQSHAGKIRLCPVDFALAYGVTTTYFLQAIDAGKVKVARLQPDPETNPDNQFFTLIVDRESAPATPDHEE